MFNGFIATPIIFKPLATSLGHVDCKIPAMSIVVSDPIYNPSPQSPSPSILHLAAMLGCGLEGLDLSASESVCQVRVRAIVEARTQVTSECSLLGWNFRFSARELASSSAIPSCLVPT